jgi:hypothetical protein
VSMGGARAPPPPWCSQMFDTKILLVILVIALAIPGNGGFSIRLL